MQERDAQKRRSGFYDKLGQGMQPRQVEKPIVDSGMQAGLPVPQQPIAPAWNKPMTQGYGAGRTPFDTTTQQPSFRSAAQSAWQSDPQMGAEEGFTPFMMPEAVKPPVFTQLDTTKDVLRDGELWRQGMPKPSAPKIGGYSPYQDITEYTPEGGLKILRKGAVDPSKGGQLYHVGNNLVDSNFKVRFTSTPADRLIARSAINPKTNQKATAFYAYNKDGVRLIGWGAAEPTAGKGTVEEQIDDEFPDEPNRADGGAVTPPTVTPTTTTRVEGWNPEWETDYALWLNGAPDDETNQADFKTYMGQ